MWWHFAHSTVSSSILVLVGRGARVFRPISFHSNEPWHTARGRCGFQYPQVGILILPGVSKDAHQDVGADASDRGLQRLGDVPADGESPIPEASRSLVHRWRSG